MDGVCMRVYLCMCVFDPYVLIVIRWGGDGRRYFQDLVYYQLRALQVSHVLGMFVCAIVGFVYCVCVLFLSVSCL